MRFVRTRQALQVTGLTPAKLREWLSRRALIPADVPPKSQNSSAQHSWETVLVLQLALILREKLRLELKAHRGTFISLRQNLNGQVFIAPWKHVLALRSPTERELIQETGKELQADAIMPRLNLCFEVLVAGFALPGLHCAVGLLDLLPTTTVDGLVTKSLKPARATTASAGQHRRRFA